MTLRTLEALRGADVVCAEDTRVTGKLLAALDISKRLERLDEATIGTRAGEIVARVADGQVIAYCSDAGMPGVSDPGLRLVRALRDAGLGECVEVLPGASAASTAYVASGCTNPRFYFGGFFPRKAAEQQKTLDGLRGLDAALIFYESPRRLLDALEAIAAAFPLREVAVCRELTKLHEEIVRGLAPEVLAEFRQRVAEAEAAGGADAAEHAIRGEIALVIDGPSTDEAAMDAETAAADAAVRAEELRGQGMRAKEIAKLLSAEFGLPRNAAYDLALGK